MSITNIAQERMVNPRDLNIAWSENSEYWSWLPLENESLSETLIEAAVLEKVCWLDINGKFETRELNPETMYEVVFVVKLEDTASGWKTPVNVKLVLPNSEARPQEQKVRLKEHRGKGWVDIPAGEFMTSPENAGEISFFFYETESNWWKTGLFVKGVVIRTKT